MNGLITLVLILTPLFIGFFLPNTPKLTHFAERALGWLVFLILLVIGIELGLVDNLHQKISQIALYLSSLLALTLGFGTLALMVFDKISWRAAHQGTTTTVQKISLRGSLTQLICLAIGFIMAKFLPTQMLPPHDTTTVLLMGLLLLVGISLKGSGTTLKEAMLNKRGVQISLVFMVVTSLAGAVFAMLFDEVSLNKGLALSAGWGWYSLSGTVMTDAYGAVWGSVALLNDLSREIIALMCIPWLMRHSRSAAIGLGGVTSLDFTLPTLQQAGGVQIVPTVISFGFITNVVSPILMVFFSSFG
ncbi:MAG: lysine exporter LysO family protein [Moraxella sp.]|nr:lysine exporter LysO family protein [Moraxella sp.]